MSGVSRRAKAANRAALRAGAEMALRNDYAVRATDPADDFMARTATALFEYFPPPNLGTIFGVCPDHYGTWAGTEYVYHGPGASTPIPCAGTKWRAVQLRGRVGVLQDQWHEAGVWPWRDGQRFINKPWVLTMDGMIGSFESFTITSEHWDADQFGAGRQQGKSTTGLNRWVNTTILPTEPPRKKHRYTPPPRRLDGRR